MHRGNYLTYRLICESRLYTKDELEVGVELDPTSEFFERRFQAFFKGINVSAEQNPRISVSAERFRQSKTGYYRLVYRASVMVPTKNSRTRVNTH